jgi:hypothetical protein
MDKGAIMTEEVKKRQDFPQMIYHSLHNPKIVHNVVEWEEYEEKGWSKTPIVLDESEKIRQEISKTEKYLGILRNNLEKFKKVAKQEAEVKEEVEEEPEKDLDEKFEEETKPKQRRKRRTKAEMQAANQSEG